jgi:hypothetical protein
MGSMAFAHWLILLIPVIPAVVIAAIIMIVRHGRKKWTESRRE